MSVGYEYRNDYSENYNDLLDFLEDIQPIKEERKELLNHLSTILYGNITELLTILIGKNRSGISKLMELLQLVFGDYSCAILPQLFTRSIPNLNKSNPILLHLLKKRLVITYEPEKKEILNSEFIKIITEKRNISVKKFNSKEIINFYPNFMIILICNYMPKIDNIDNIKIKEIQFKTEFVENPIKDNQKKINNNINLNFDKWKTDFMLLLINTYKENI